MKKKGITLGIALLCLILLLICYFLLCRYNTQQEQQEDDAQTVLELDADTITSVTMELDGAEETFVKEDDVWTLESDKDFSVDSDTVTAVVTSLTEMTTQRVLENVEDLEEYGLKNPQRSICLKDANGNTYTVDFGDYNDITGNDYVYIEEQGTNVSTVSDTVLSGISSTLDSYEKVEESTTEEDTEE